MIGWDINDVQDLYNMLSTVKIGDIIYLKANRLGSLDLRIKGIGIVRNSFLNILFEKGENLSSTRNNFELPVECIDTDEFFITIPSNTGKLTNIRAAILYEEFLPFVQNEILIKLLQKSHKLSI